MAEEKTEASRYVIDRSGGLGAVCIIDKTTNSSVGKFADGASARKALGQLEKKGAISR
jgi:hypothetical protein